MRLNDIQTRIPLWYENGIAIYLVGRVGRGKTTTISRAPARIAKHLGRPAKAFGFVCIAGTLLNPPDAVGYMMPRSVGDHLEAVFTQPFWFRTDEGKTSDRVRRWDHPHRRSRQDGRRRQEDHG